MYVNLEDLKLLIEGNDNPGIFINHFVDGIQVIRNIYAYEGDIIIEI